MKGTTNTLNVTIGDLSDLQTTDKSSLVAAINEAAAGGGGGSGMTLKAQSSGNATNASQLAELQTAFTALTTEEKLRAVITYDGINRIAKHVGNGQFMFEFINNGTGLFVNMFDVPNAKRYSGIVGSAFTDMSSQTESYVFYLYA